MRFRTLLIAGSLPALVLTALPTSAAAASVHGHHDVLKPGGGASTSTTASTAPLQFGGGSVLVAPAAYIVFWGSEWQNGFTDSGGHSSSQAQNYFSTFLSDSGGSAWQGTTTEYCQGVSAGASSCSGGQAITNPAGRLLGTWVDGASPAPSSPTDAQIQAEAQNAAQHFNGGSNTVYFVLTPSGKSESGFGSQWCAWHSGTGSLAYAYIPYMPDAGASCGRNSVNGSTDAFGHGWFDGYSIVGGHEYLEAITDPYPNGGWVDSGGQENADKCQWSSTWPATNQAIGGHTFAVQPMWSNRAGGCVFSAPAPPPACGTSTSTCGYDILTAGGGIYTFGSATYHGNLIDHGYPGPAVGLAVMPDGGGYQILTAGGGLYSFGSAAGHYYGNLIDHGYPGPAVAIAMMPDGNGYQILTAGGGLYSFGSAAGHYYGNLIDHGYPGPAIGLAMMPDGNGYAILTAGGGLYSFGSAAGHYYGNLIDHGYPGPAAAIAMTRSGSGYSILTRAGGIYSFGDATYFGNLIDHGYPGPAVSLANTP